MSLLNEFSVKSLSPKHIHEFASSDPKYDPRKSPARIENCIFFHCIVRKDSPVSFTTLGTVNNGRKRSPIVNVVVCPV